MFINNIVNKRKQDLIETFNNLYYVNNNKTWALLQNKDIWTLYLVCSSIFDFKIWGSIKNPILTILYIKMGKIAKSKLTLCLGWLLLSRRKQHRLSKKMYSRVCHNLNIFSHTNFIQSHFTPFKQSVQFGVEWEILKSKTLKKSFIRWPLPMT